MNRETEQKVIERLADLVQEEQDAGFMLALAMVETWLNERREKADRSFQELGKPEDLLLNYSGKLSVISDVLAYLEMLRGQQERYNG